MRITEAVTIVLALIPFLGFVLAAFNGVQIDPGIWGVVLSLTGIILGAITVWIKQRRART